MVCESVILVLVKDFNIVRVSELPLTSTSNYLSGLVVRVSALRLGGLGSIPGGVIPEKSSLLGTQRQGLHWSKSRFMTLLINTCVLFKDDMAHLRVCM